MIGRTGGTRGQGAFFLPGMVELEEKYVPSKVLVLLIAPL
jgi:hypothetical protein